MKRSSCILVEADVEVLVFLGRIEMGEVVEVVRMVLAGLRIKCTLQLSWSKVRSGGSVVFALAARSIHRCDLWYKEILNDRNGYQDY